MNWLEQLVAEWYEYQGYFVRRNVLVGRRANGGWECELDVVAFHPGLRPLVHIEPSMDSNSWEVRAQRYARRFEAGRRHIPKLFEASRFRSVSSRSRFSGWAARSTTPSWQAARSG
ncbi:hypothetical protein [Lysobacter sp. N42]|uniref:hypothetical protein n=1 Tax=Lysobacter sp. N42 TaxID=2545719 RepID=UPI00104C3B57|nr:hypothetical protein [Lysobacter sp. N42]TCZ85031.1 hypothetical protein EYQ95_19485 [Lysobacter sp. N42]